MRFFIALEIPEHNKAEFKEIQQRIHHLIPQCRITDADKLHLTLAFLGDQNEQLKDQLIEIITHAVDGIAPFEVTPAYLDGFPNIHRPDLFWVGVKGDIDKVLIIRERIKDGLSDIELPVDERRFIPHITVAKIKADINIDRDLENKIQEFMFHPFEPIQISAIKLIESVADNGNHTHNTLAEIRLT